MLIQYQNTFEEFSEASRILALTKTRKGASKRLLYVVGIMVFFFATSKFWIEFAGMNAMQVFANLVGPFVCMIIVIFVVAIFNSLLSGKLPKITWRTAVSLGVFLMLIGDFVGMRVLERLTHPAGTPSALLDWRILMPHTTWLFYLTCLMILTFYNRRRTVRTLWDAQPSLQRMKTVDISADGVVFSDDKTRLQYSWPGFVGWQETKTLFLLKNSSKSAYIIPKRAFAGDEELNAMRALCELIPRTTDAAFPVVTDQVPSSLSVQQNLST